MKQPGSTPLGRSIVHVIRLMCTDQSRSVADVLRHADISGSTFAAYANGSRDIPLGILAAIAEELGVAVDEIVRMADARLDHSEKPANNSTPRNAS